MTTDLSDTILPKSDQLNSDDLIPGPRTITVTRVALTGEDQPVEIFYEGDGGKPFRPGKSMRRLLVRCWGSDGAKYVGRSMTLYRDEKVMFGGVAVGGIRISHMSDLEGEVTMALTASKTSRKPFTVRPLRGAPGPGHAPQDAANQWPVLAPDGRLHGVAQGSWQKAVKTALSRLEGAAAVREWRVAMGPHLASIAEIDRAAAKAAEEAIEARLTELAAPPEEPEEEEA